MFDFKKIRYAIEAFFLSIAFGIFKLLPLDTASRLGGAIGRILGPRMGASRKALANIRMALPGLDDTAQRRILMEMWDNLGRVMAEYPHLERICRERTEIVDIDMFHRLRDDNQPGIIVAAHMANWEICGPAAFLHGGFPLDLVYRTPNNPWVDRLLKSLRPHGIDQRSMSKSSAGMRQIYQALKEGRHVGILIDQKYNEGVPALFFGRPAMTSQAFVQLPQKFKCPLALARIERTSGAHFRISAVPIAVFDADGKARPLHEVITEAHGYLERWISERPGQWLWLHRRWSERAEREFAKTA